MTKNAGVYYQKAVPSASITEPVSLDELKMAAKVDHDDLDTDITSKGIAARQDIERWTGVKLVNHSVVARIYAKYEDYSLSMWPYVFDVDMIENLVVKQLTKGEDPETLVIDEDYYFDNDLSFLSTGDYQLEYDIVVSDVPETLKEAIKMLVTYRINITADDKDQMGVPKDVMEKIENFRQPVL